ncbi:MAG TPA: pyridoxal phosphate-dependent aminotransferase [Candidatus Sulfotelmatobacter sp.]|nr:pyridoxal phosphate-dependent aminotransferase [Candidatus Sulfotelmatobacter sp.]
MPRFSRRSFLHLSAAVGTATAFRVMSEPMFAAAARRRPHAPDAVTIDSNENPLGPCQSARDAMAAILPQGGRYADNLTDELVATFAKIEGLNPEYIHATVGSTPPLALSVLAFTSPQKSYVTADPGFETGMMMAEHSGARTIKVPLTKTYAHDVKAMLAAGSDAGVFYICNPNNPTGTLTPRSDIDYLVANKPKDSIVLIDEAYIHLAEAPSTLDLVKAGKDVIVLRTFSKVYGLAGIRCGFIIARPDLADKVLQRGGWNFMPVTAVVAATTSLKDPNLVSERRRINATIRQQTFDWLTRNGYSFIPSESNCFMLDTKRPGQEVRDAMAKENVLIGRIWPIMPTYVRITVGTQEEMTKFQTAFQKVMKA